MENKKKGIAIGYSGRDTPRILAIARGILVDKLVRIAEEHNITIYRNSDLAESLAMLNVDSDIPENLFRTVAEVLAYCYNVNEEFRKKVVENVNLS